MSMIEISALRKLAELQNTSYHKSIINRATDTIEALSAKLADMERSAKDCGSGGSQYLNIQGKNMIGCLLSILTERKNVCRKLQS